MDTLLFVGPSVSCIVGPTVCISVIMALYLLVPDNALVRSVVLGMVAVIILDDDFET